MNTNPNFNMKRDKTFVVRSGFENNVDAPVYENDYPNSGLAIRRAHQVKNRFGKDGRSRVKIVIIQTLIDYEDKGLEGTVIHTEVIFNSEN